MDADSGASRRGWLRILGRVGCGPFPDQLPWLPCHPSIPEPYLNNNDGLLAMEWNVTNQVRCLGELNPAARGQTAGMTSCDSFQRVRNTKYEHEGIEGKRVESMHHEQHCIPASNDDAMTHWPRLGQEHLRARVRARVRVGRAGQGRANQNRAHHTKDSKKKKTDKKKKTQTTRVKNSNQINASSLQDERGLKLN